MKKATIYNISIIIVKQLHYASDNRDTLFRGEGHSSSMARPTHELTEQSALGVIAIASGILAVLLMLPYLQYILLAVVLAYALMPLHNGLKRIVGPTASALSLIIASFLTIIIPVLYIVVIAAQQASGLTETLLEEGLSVTAIQQRLDSSGYSIDSNDVREAYEANQDPINRGLDGMLGGTLEIIGGIPSIAISLTVTMFVVFGLLRDGDRLVAWFQTIVPISDEVKTELFSRLDRLMWASVIGNVIVSAIQALLLGIGFWVLEVPGVIFLTVVTFLLALLPLIGVFGTWIPISIYLLIVGRPVAALLMIGYGMLVSLSDTYIRPAVIGKSGELSSAVIVVGIFGGIAVLGPIGLFVGPVILGTAKISFDLFAREWYKSKSA
ncbi:putative inner membrane protein [Halalkalicoccus paucihalophilus]|uniref:Putative inner membrane protein n=2 Tax=Halalkalicoccus paucihalophilus TaxID=1008153 RepID=A0A151ABB0_9EURY|nr:putative inner membrane protein [Halalkalicoccus paucihalophilus]